MAGSASGVARFDLAVLDCQLGGFFKSLSATHSNRISIRISRTRGTYRWVALAWTGAREANQVGASLALARASAVHDARGGSFAVGFLLSAFFSFRYCNLASVSSATGAAVSVRGHTDSR